MGQSVQKVQWPKSLPIKMPESACSVYGSCWQGKWFGATIPIGSNFTQCGESDRTQAHQWVWRAFSVGRCTWRGHNLCKICEEASTAAIKAETDHVEWFHNEAFGWCSAGCRQPQEWTISCCALHCRRQWLYLPIGSKHHSSAGTIVIINKHAFIASVTRESLGDLGEAKLRINPDARPRVLPCRRIPIALQEEVRQQVNELVERGVLVRVGEPTAWVSQMTVTRKESDGSLRICIDPQPLNAVLMCEHFKMPALDDVLPSLHNARVFTKLDVKEAFWHVRLDEQSSLLTTMITPFGRFRWARLPFGLSVSSEIFQNRLTEALGGLKGVICAADDIIVVGRGDTQAEAENDHSENPSGLQNRCKEKNIKLNDVKAAIHQDEISFMSHRISVEGVQPDRSKVAAILDIPPPNDVHGVRRLCGYGSVPGQIHARPRQWSGTNQGIDKAGQRGELDPRVWWRRHWRRNQDSCYFLHPFTARLLQLSPYGYT